jgi:transcriptional regulator GlxA family with amidase domain
MRFGRNRLADLVAAKCERYYTARMTARRVSILTLEGGQNLDVTGPLEIFAVASHLLKKSGNSSAGYKIQVAAPKAGTIQMSSGIRLVTDVALRNLQGPFDTLIVAGGFHPSSFRHPELLLTVKRLAPHTRRLASVCTGAFVLAEAGLLTGKKVTTHWQWCSKLAGYPNLQVESDSIFVRDGNLWTSAGVTAGLDLSLAMVEQDHGQELALDVARQLVLFLKRPGGQSQYSNILRAQRATATPLRELLSWLPEHVQEDLSVNSLAKQVGMSPRNFARSFIREVGVTPARLVEKLRVDAARRQLEQSDDTVDRIAAQCGFGTTETMRRAFLRHLRVAPSAYRGRFASTRQNSFA